MALDWRRASKATTWALCSNNNASEPVISAPMPGFGRSPGGPELNPSLRVEEELNKQLAAFRDGTGKDVEFLLDLNFNFKTEGTSASSVRWSGTG